MHKALSDEIWGPEERAMRSKRMKTEVERSVLGRFRLETKAFRAEPSLKSQEVTDFSPPSLRRHPILKRIKTKR